MNVLVLGAGKVGTALAHIISKKHDVTLWDKEAWKIVKNDPDDPYSFDVMHVCYPYSDSFVDTTVDYIRKFNPELTLIESTVKVETTDTIHGKLTPNQLLCHSPVRGLHVNLLWGIQTYTKFIGGCTLKASLTAKRYYESIGLKTYMAKSPYETECAKLMNLSYYATCIALFQEFERIRDKHNLNYDDILQFFETTTYESEGEFPRPIYHGNYISGICVMQGMNMLLNPGRLSQWINESNAKAKK